MQYAIFDMFYIGMLGFATTLIIILFFGFIKIKLI